MYEVWKQERRNNSFGLVSARVCSSSRLKATFARYVGFDVGIRYSSRSGMGRHLRISAFCQAVPPSSSIVMSPWSRYVLPQAGSGAASLNKYW